MERIGELVMKYVPPLVGVIVFLFLANLIGRWIGRLVARALGRAKVEKTLCNFLGGVARWGLLILAAIACLGVFGVETISFAAIIGVAGLAVGLAFQGSLANLAAGVMLLIFRPFKAGDVISVSGQTGRIEGIGLFSTQMDTFDNRRIILPNRVVFGSTIESMTHHPKRRVDVSVGVEYPAEIDHTRDVLIHAAHSVPGRVDNPAPQVVLLGLGDSSVNWQVRVWTETARYWEVLDATTRAVKMQLDEAGIHIPYPQMDVHFDRAAVPIR